MTLISKHILMLYHSVLCPVGQLTDDIPLCSLFSLPSVIRLTKHDHHFNYTIMISHHVHCFHYLLHGKTWPGPSRSVHLVEKGFSIDSIGFCIYIVYIYLLWFQKSSKDIKLLWSIKFLEPKLLDEELFVNCKYQWPLIIVSRREWLDLSQLYLFTSCSGQHC